MDHNSIKSAPRMVFCGLGSRCGRGALSRVVSGNVTTHSDKKNMQLNPTTGGMRARSLKEPTEVSPTLGAPGLNTRHRAPVPLVRGGRHT